MTQVVFLTVKLNMIMGTRWLYKVSIWPNEGATLATLAANLGGLSLDTQLGRSQLKKIKWSTDSPPEQHKSQKSKSRLLSAPGSFKQLILNDAQDVSRPVIGQIHPNQTPVRPSQHFFLSKTMLLSATAYNPVIGSMGNKFEILLIFDQAQWRWSR